MKSQIFWIRDAGMLLAILLSTGGCLQQVSEPAQQVAAESAEAVSPELIASQNSSESMTAGDENSDLVVDEFSEKAEVSNAPAVAVSDELAVPANVHPGPGMVQVIKLVNSGVEDSVLMAYVTNSEERFNLGPDEIIYLNDIGLPGRVITAMLQRDHILQAMAAPPPGWDEPIQAAANENSEPHVSVNPGPGLAPMPVNYGPGPDSYLQESQPVPPTTAPLFYDSLAPYGSWVDVDGYGRCWQPTVVIQQPEWQPYLDCGRWVYTDCGWYWKSDYSWGWAAFHYGRWFRHARLGWCWCPDDVWAPSWVCWRTTDDYCGWAPLPPGCGFNVAGELCWQGRPCAPNFNFGLGWNCFHFVSSHDVCDNHVSHRVIPRAKVPHIFHRTVVSNPTSSSTRVVSNNGASRDRIAAATGHDLPRVTLRPTDPAATQATRDRFESNGKVLAVYRPRGIGSVVGHSETPGASRSQNNSVQARLESGQTSSTLASGTVSHPANRQPPAISSAGSTRTVPPLILRGSDFRTGGNTPATGSGRSRDAVASAGSSQSGANNVRGITNLRPGAPAVSGGSSLVIIGHRGGSHDLAHSSIKVFSTPPAVAAAASSESRQTAQQASSESAVQRAAYNRSYQQQQERNQQYQHQPNETVPWWLNRATPNQPQTTQDEIRQQQQQVRPEPRQHFDRGTPGQANQPGRQESPQAPVHSQPSQARSESRNSQPPPAVSAPASSPASAPAAASSSSSSSRSSAPAQSSGSGRR